MGGYSQIQQDSIDLRDLQLRQDAVHIGEVPLHHLSTGIGRQPLGGSRDGIRVLVNGDEASGGQPFGDLPGMSGAAGCAIHIDAVRSDIQRLNALIEQH